MNKRAAPRFPLILDVAVTFPGEVHRVCTIRDYCTGGMYFLCRNDEGGGLPAGKDDLLRIEFSNPLLQQGRRYQLNGRVARVTDNGFGIAFIEQNPDAIAALGQLAESQAAASRAATATSGSQTAFSSIAAKAAIDECRDTADGLIEQVLKSFFTRVNDALFNKAGEATNNAQQAAYFGAMNELRKAQDTITHSFIDRFNEQFDILTTPGFRSTFTQEEQPQTELSLVESDVLDNWLAVRAMAAKLEEKMQETLEPLEVRFEAISANPITLENNPVGPFVLASVFHEAINPLVLDDIAKSTIFSVMEGLLHEQLKKLYDELNSLLIKRGILPDYTKKLEVVRPAGSTSTPAGGTTAEPLVSEVETVAVSAQQHVQFGRGATAQSGSHTQQRITPGGAATAQSDPHARQNAMVDSAAPVESSPNIQNTSAVQISEASTPATPMTTGPELSPISYARAQVAQGQAANTSMASMAPTGGVGAIGGAYQGVQELMRLQHNTEATAGDGDSPVDGYYSSGEVMQALGHLEQAVAHVDREASSTLDHVHYLAESLKSVIGDEGKALNDDDREKVAYVGGMFSSILQDHLVPQHAKPWFSTLEVPLLKAGLLDRSLVADEAHPARLLLNRLESIGDLLQGDDSSRAQEARHRIESIVGSIRDNVEHDANVFVTALDDLENVEEEVRESYEENVAILIAELEKETNLNRARQAILQGLNHRLGQREVPKVILELLDIGWKNLLLRTYLKSGADSSAYKTYLNVIDQLYARLMETMPYSQDAVMSDETLMEWLERMLTIVSDDETRNTRLLGNIREHLTDSEAATLEAQYVPALVSKMLNREHHGEVDKPADVSDDIWQLMLLDVGEMQNDEAYLHRNEERGEHQVILIWHDAQDPRYVFVDSTGHKCLDLNLGEVANLFYRKVLSHLDEKALPVTERATYHFLQSLHSQLAYQAQHDELTGLLNRKAFEKELEDAFVSAKSGELTHALGYIDLDRFNVINTTCGHTEGDVLLGRVAGILKETLGGEVIIGRLGGDEFGILLKGCGRTEGLKKITEVHDAIRGIQFVCENNEFKVTASIGLAEINELSDSSGRLLSAVDAAAFTAKDMGRDNIQIYNSENERISSHRNILDWVGRINVLFEKNLIQLRCQKIKPMHATINSLPHYEVLLDVKDEDGNKVPLDEFIVAAERYNRIIDIDTWVVDYVLKWMEERLDKLSRISGISINLSGSSLGNRKFMEHVEGALSKPGFPADKLCFEITETIAINNLDNALRFMKKIKDTGCQFSLDDFGTGTSSYSYLRSLPIDYLKIDGAFVKDIAKNSDDYAVVRSINEIGHAMGKKTIAEYVEDEFAYEALKQIGIDYVQGFGVEKPIPLFKLFG